MTPAEPVHAAPGTSSRCTRASSWRPPFRNTRDTAAMSAASSELLLLSGGGGAGASGEGAGVVSEAGPRSAVAEDGRESRRAML